jgi:secreted Zn-dependent insulinase-like peptidase
MQENVWLPQDRLKAAEEITSETFIKRAQSALIRRRVTSHIHGDMSQEAALALYDQSIAILGSNIGKENHTTDVFEFFRGTSMYFHVCILVSTTQCY